MIETSEKMTLAHYQYVQNLSEFDCIKSENINIAIYRRAIAEALNVYVEQLIDIDFNPLIINTSVNDFDDLFDQHFNGLSAQYKFEHNLLRNDIKQLVRQFSEVCNTSSLKIFFGIISTNMCQRFHVDMYELRMLCTYSGQGTLWLTEDNVNYEALSNHENDAQIELRENDIQQLKAYDTAIIKGALYPNSRVGGLVHKSPAIENLNQKRIMLRVDSNSLFDSIQ